MEVGVVIGRFQVDSLHDGHRFLIQKAFESFRRVIICVGCAPIMGTKHDPLDYQTRLRMLQAEYPDAIVLPLHDQRSDKDWSEKLDAGIRSVVPNVTRAVLFGGRDSFQAHYTGAFTAIEVDSGISFRNGTEQRTDLGKVVRNSPDFRAGVIYSTQNAWPHTRVAVDIAVLRGGAGADVPAVPGRRARAARVSSPTPGLASYAVEFVEAPGVDILLGRKAEEGNKWRLPGGMVDRGESFERAAVRELLEETGLTAGDETGALEYVCSAPIGDWRFKNAGEIGLVTALFRTRFVRGAPAAGSDLVEVKWFPLKDAERAAVNAHKPLISALLEKKA